ncbi:MAG: outer membrane protein assembly factor BamB family protein [Planctomycetota bacterium]|jgi:outer membrane protein assembly factor BamB
MILTLGVLVGLSGLIGTTSGQEWARFRGANGEGVSDAKNIPTRFTTKDYKWNVPLEGMGHSSPVIWGDKVFVTSAAENKTWVKLYCLSVRDGSTIWTKQYDTVSYRQHKYNSMASASPVVDGERVYISLPSNVNHELVALTMDGKEVWRHGFGAFDSQHGNGVSPIVYKDKVIMANDHRAGGTLVALNRKTGKVEWEIQRESTDKTPYSIPTIIKGEDGKDQMIFLSKQQGFTGVDPNTGKVIWELRDTFDKRPLASPVYVDGLVLGSSGSGGGASWIVAVKPGTDDKPAKEAYKVTRAVAYTPTPVVYEGNVFMLSDAGVMTCFDGATGKTHWMQRPGGDYFGSPVVVNGKIYCINKAGQVQVLAASEKYEHLGTHDLGEPSYATPAISGGQMYLRTLGRLVCIGGGASVND